MNIAFEWDEQKNMNYFLNNKAMTKPFSVPSKKISAAKELELSLKNYDTLSDENIDYSDIPDTSHVSWMQTLSLQELLQKDEKSERIALRVKPQVKQWYKQHFPRYQTAMHHILEEYMKHAVSK